MVVCLYVRSSIFSFLLLFSSFYFRPPPILPPPRRKKKYLGRRTRKETKMLGKLPPELLEMIFKDVLVYVRPIQTNHPVTPSRSGGRWPLPYRSVSVPRSDLALFSVSWYVREVALRVFWAKNTFLYCPESVGNSKVCGVVFLYTHIFLYTLCVIVCSFYLVPLGSAPPSSSIHPLYIFRTLLTRITSTQKAITFLTAQPTYVLNNYLRNLQVHFFLEHTHRFSFDEEFTARLQPLERIMKKLDWPRATTERGRDRVRKNSKSKRRVDFRLWPSGEHHGRQTCRHVRYMALAWIKNRVQWRFRRLGPILHGLVADEHVGRMHCRRHAADRNERGCVW